ncbi:SRPBCC family protein [Pseudoruegeria sp. HB172150]|uniref:SRPBCC family protein n=1 Tax=Pseudoruegeria sp. HB172150 TaxID=2721164 RepID=UPI001554AC37|nr:SRPBCC family protein [Pseudoruegeria sp. HB172150]
MTAETDLVLHRILKAPRSLVWRCWTDPELLKPWFIPKPHFISEVKMDVRPGGQFFTMMNVDGNAYPNDGSFLEVVPEEKLVFTDLLLADYQPVAEPGLGFTATLTFKDHPEGTEYTALARHRTPEQAEKHEEMGFSQGWGTVATQLEEFARSLMD